tara:strand:- start:702 stop:1139 length:438 start_codon:yes stop_codon:yes gene_type:complete
MILISHRGNINGIDFVQENTKPYIQNAIDLGYDVEVDIRYEDNNFLFGHDYGQYDVELQWLLDRKDKLWVHCKDFKSLSKLIDTEVRVFYHQKEDYTIISDGHIWAHNLSDIDDKCIIPLLSEKELKNWKRTDVYGICSDYVGIW